MNQLGGRGHVTPPDAFGKVLDFIRAGDPESTPGPDRVPLFALMLGDRWPSLGVRLEMLQEAIEVIRLLHSGQQISHHGTHYEVQDAQIYTCPEQTLPIYVSGFGPQAAEFAGRLGDGYCTAMPDADLVKAFRKAVVETSPFRLARRSAGIGIGMRASMRRTGFGPTRACPVSSRRRFLGQRTSPMP
jgi:hypothetical protein